MAAVVVATAGATSFTVTGVLDLVTVAIADDVVWPNVVVTVTDGVGNRGVWAGVVNRAMIRLVEGVSLGDPLGDIPGMTRLGVCCCLDPSSGTIEAFVVFCPTILGVDWDIVR